jgi:hypothetical protein
MSDPKLPKVDPNAVYLCIMGHVSKGGTFAAGARHRGASAGVTESPVHWMLDGSTDQEIAQAIVVRFGGGAVRFGPQA